MSTVAAKVPDHRRAPAGGRGARAAPALAFSALVLAAVYCFVAFRTWPGTDSMHALLWARDIRHEVRPAFDGYRTPSEHPLLIGLGMLLAPLGDAAPRGFVLLCETGLVALVAALWRLGRMVAGVPGAVIAATLVLTRLDFPLTAAFGFLDVLYCGLVAWAVALEAKRPRRGLPVWLLLVFAGLLRPEAWLLTGLYGLWILRGDLRRLPEAVAFVALAPSIWMLSDLVVTGDALFSLHHVHAMAAELERSRPAPRLPGLVVKHLEEILKPPVLLGGVLGAAIAVRLAPRLRARDDASAARALALCGALVIVTCANYVLIASGGGLAIIYRYLLTAAVGLIVLCTFAVGGWSILEPGRLRRWWATGAVAIVALAVAWTVGHLHPGLIRPKLDRRTASHDDLMALLHDPAFVAARRCGPISVPNHKLIADIRWTLRLPDGAVRPRSLRSAAPARYGIAIVIDRRVARHKELDVREVPSDGPEIQVPPVGFRPITHNRTFVAWARCPDWAPWRSPRAG